MKYTITQIVKGTTAKFQYSKHGKLFYMTEVEDTKYLFPIDVTDLNDIGDGVFEIEHKTINFMRWINKAIKDGSIIEIYNDSI